MFNNICSLWLMRVIFWLVSTASKVLKLHHKYKDVIEFTIHNFSSFFAAQSSIIFLDVNFTSNRIFIVSSGSTLAFIILHTFVKLNNNEKIASRKNGFFSRVYFTFFRINLVQYGQHSYNHISHFFGDTIFTGITKYA